VVAFAFAFGVPHGSLKDLEGSLRRLPHLLGVAETNNGFALALALCAFGFDAFICVLLPGFALDFGVLEGLLGDLAGVATPAATCL